MSTGATYAPAPPDELQRQDVAALLQHSYRWTCAAATVVPAAAQQVAPALTIAAQLYEARQYPAALTQLAGVAVLVHRARLACPALPEL